MSNVTDDCPEGIVTDVGTVASLVSLDMSVTTSGSVVSVLRVTVAVVAAAPAPSLTDAAAMLNVRPAGASSSSVTSSESLPLA